MICGARSDRGEQRGAFGWRSSDPRCNRGWCLYRLPGSFHLIFRLFTVSNVAPSVPDRRFGSGLLCLFLLQPLLLLLPEQSFLLNAQLLLLLLPLLLQELLLPLLLQQKQLLLLHLDLLL